MIIDDKKKAYNVLSNISYYHLSPYWKPFCIDGSDNFKNETRFSRIIEIYRFDKELRELLLKYIAPIEVSYKTAFINDLCGATSNAFAYLDKKNFSNMNQWENSVKKIIDEFDKSEEPYSVHHKQFYPEILPPLWLVSEFLTLGELNYWVSNIVNTLRYDDKTTVRDNISNHFGMNFNLFKSFIMALTNIRNFCAHQCRVWDRELYNQPKTPTKQKNFLYKNMITNFKAGQKKGIYNTLVILAFCLRKIQYPGNFPKELMSLIDKYHIEADKMGFPDNWKQLPLWLNN